MLEKELYSTKKVTTESNIELLLKYFITTYQSEEQEKTKVYGVEVEKYSENSTVIESAIAKNISYDISFIESVVCKLSNATVTPITLECVLDEIIYCV